MWDESTWTAQHGYGGVQKNKEGLIKAQVHGPETIKVMEVGSFISGNGIDCQEIRDQFGGNYPKLLIDVGMETAHKDKLASHLGYHGSRRRIERRFAWSGMTNDISKYIKSCQEYPGHSHRIGNKKLFINEPSGYASSEINVIWHGTKRGATLAYDKGARERKFLIT